MGHGSRECSADPSSDVSMAARDPQFTVRFDKGQGDSLGSSPGHCDPQQAQPEQLCPATRAESSRPAPYLQCTHPEGEDVHSSPISLLCKNHTRTMSVQRHRPPLMPHPPPHRSLRSSARAASPPQHTSSLHKPFPLIPLKFAQKYSRRGSHHKFSHGKKTFYSFFPNCCNFLHF